MYAYMHICVWFVFNFAEWTDSLPPHPRHLFTVGNKWKELVPAITALPLLLWRRCHHCSYNGTTLVVMTSLPPLFLWRDYWYYDVTTLAIMTSPPLLLWCHHPCYYDVTILAIMTLPPLLLWRHHPCFLWRYHPCYYDVTNLYYYEVTTLATMTSPPLLLWRHYTCYYDVTILAIMTSPPLLHHVVNIQYFFIPALVLRKGRLSYRVALIGGFIVSGVFYHIIVPSFSQTNTVLWYQHRHQHRRQIMAYF